MSNGRTRTLDQVRLGILHGDWRPGARLQPVELARTFETSTTVVREALSLMVGDGLVVSRPNHGFFVPELDLEELKVITELRCRTEEFGGQLACQNGDLQWEVDLTAAHHRLARSPRRLASDPGRINPDWASAHHAFHLAILQGSGSASIAKLAANLADATELYRRWAAATTSATRRDVEAEHAEILEAALARDGSRLGNLLRVHYERTLAVVLDAGIATCLAS